MYNLHIYGTINFGVEQADRYVDELGALIEFLAEFPRTGRERTGVRPPVRLYPYLGHNVIYRLEGDELVVVRVLHHSANWQTLL